MTKDPPQPRRIQPTRRLHQHRFGLDGDLLGELLGAGGEHPGMSRRELAAGEGGGGGGQGPPNSARAVRTELAAAPAPSRSRLRSQPAVEVPSWPWSAPAAPRPSTPASSLSHWPSRRSTMRRSSSTRSAHTLSASQPLQVLGRQLIRSGRQPGQPLRSPV
jgi:hypothetical protein